MGSSVIWYPRPTLISVSVRGKRKSDVVTYDADVVVDAAGALSILQDKADLADATFDTNVNYS
ncbi:MAG TPA: hypothetical protein VJ898_11555, partial [Natrialbaceae archaeon]|nr:hypothetical protein [Natrialbaceae archaeon]